MFDLTIHELGRCRYNEMLKEAELERRWARLRQRDGITRVQQALLRLSQLLTNAGSWLRQYAETQPSLGNAGQR